MSKSLHEQLVDALQEQDEARVTFRFCTKAYDAASAAVDRDVAGTWDAYIAAERAEGEAATALYEASRTVRSLRARIDGAGLTLKSAGERSDAFDARGRV